jgi:hypothetical protein
MAANTDAAEVKRNARELESSSSEEAIQLPSVRTYTHWTPRQIQSVESTADSGNIRPIVDLCEGLILPDDKVRGALDGRINALFGTDVTFEASGDGRRKSRAVNKLEAGEDWDFMFPDPEAKQVMSWALILGLGPGVQRWARRNDHEGRDVPTLRFFHPQPFRYDWPTRMWMRRVESGPEEPVVFGDGVWFGHMPFGTYRPWALGLWRGLARWCLLKAYAISDYGQAGETAAARIVTADKDLNTSNAQGGSNSDPRQRRRDLGDSISQMARNGVCVLPPGYDLKLVELSASTSAIYEKQIQLADNAIAIAIRGGNLTTDVSGGSRSAAEVQERTGDLANLRQDAGGWATTTHEQTLRAWSYSNFGTSALAPWPVYDVEPEEDRKVKAETMVVALEGAKAATDLGFELDREAFAKEFGLTEFLKPGEEPEPTDPVAPPDPDQEDGAEPTEEGASEAAQNSADLLDQLRGRSRVIVAGGPRSGKSTLSAQAGERFKLKLRHGDSLIGKKKWSEASDEVAAWLDESDQWLVEGVVAVRALRKWLTRNPGKPLNATVLWLRDPVQARTKRQAAMAKSVEKIWNEILPDLTARGVAVIERDAK